MISRIDTVRLGAVRADTRDNGGGPIGICRHRGAAP